MIPDICGVAIEVPDGLPSYAPFGIADEAATKNEPRPRLSLVVGRAMNR